MVIDKACLPLVSTVTGLRRLFFLLRRMTKAVHAPVELSNAVPAPRNSCSVGARLPESGMPQHRSRSLHDHRVRTTSAQCCLV